MIFFIILLGATSALHKEAGVLQSALSNPAEFTKLFSEYAADQDRHYLAKERRLRAGLFRDSLKEVLEHNGQDEDWEMELNMFADMTEEEKAAYTGFNATAALENLEPEEEVVPQYFSNPDSKDWRGVAVTKVKNQGRCGSCWIFSAVGALEGHYKTQGSALKSFSEQEGLNCIQRNGCGGGYMGKVYDWLKRSGRLGHMKEIPYTGRQTTCNHASAKNHLIAFKVNGYSNTRGDSGHVTALATTGPLSVGYSVARDFFNYRGGIYKNSYCRGGGHAVTSVGYAPDYFRMKNSWGASWGEGGYFRIGRGNVCGITNMGLAPRFTPTGQKDDGTDEEGDSGDNDGGDNDGECQEGFKKCPDGRCVHEHWHC